MGRYDQSWVDALLAAAPRDACLVTSDQIRLHYVVTDTEDGKQSFTLEFDDCTLTGGTAGKLPRGDKADITVTGSEAVLVDVWAGRRSRDAVFMAADVKIEGRYEVWLDQLVPAFERANWANAWKESV